MAIELKPGDVYLDGNGYICILGGEIQRKEKSIIYWGGSDEIARRDSPNGKDENKTAMLLLGNINGIMVSLREQALEKLKEGK